MEIIFLIGKILLGGFFIYNGYTHFASLDGYTGFAQSKGIPMPKIAVGATGAMLLIGGLSLLTGVRPFIGIIILLAFLLPTTFTMHQFWKITDPMQKMSDRVSFSKNIALIGALIMLLLIALMSSAPWMFPF